MTDTERKALALVNEVSDGFHDVTSIYSIHTAKALRAALCRAIEQHEAFRQEVSEFALGIQDYLSALNAKGWIAECSSFIIAKPDPLVEAMQEWWDADGYASIETFRAAIEKRGGKLTWGEG